MVKSLNELLEIPFSRRSTDDQIKTILEGKPKPQLPNVFLNKNPFDVSFYDSEQWITACDKSCAFYCWSCLLFAFAIDDNSPWTTEGYRDFENLHANIIKHNSSFNHLEGLLKMHEFVKRNITLAAPPNIPQDCEVDRKHFNQRLLTFICGVISETFYSTPDVNKFKHHIFRKCKEALMLFLKKEKKDFIKAINNLCQPKVLTSYLESLSFMVKTWVMKEMSNSCVSIIANEHYSNNMGVLISVMFRYLKNGKVCERFLEFYLIEPDDYDSLIQIILRECGCAERLVSVSSDYVMPDLTQFQTYVTNINRAYGAVFLPCHYHSFETIIERRLSQVDSQNDRFFKMICSMLNFLLSSKVRNSFNSILQENNLNFNYTNQSSFIFIKNLKLCKKLFLKLFIAIQKNHEEWTVDDFMKAKGFYILLRDPYITFLIETYFILSPIVVEINDILHSSTPEKMFKKYQYEIFQKQLLDIKSRDYDSIWETTCTKLKKLDPRIFQELEYMKKFYTTTQNIFSRSVDSIITEIKIRIESLEKYNKYFSMYSSVEGMLHLVHQKNFEYFPANRTLNLLGLQNDITKLKKEQSYLISKPAHTIYDLLTAQNLQRDFPELCKVLEVFHTIPLKESSRNNCEFQETENKSTAVKNLSKFEVTTSYSKLYQNRKTVTNDWIFLSIEKDFVLFLSKHELFYNEFYNLLKRNNRFWD